MNRLPVRLKVATLLAVMLVAQTSLLSGLRIRHVCPDVMLLTTIAAGVVGGEEAGAAVGFAAGLLVDLFLQTPIGLSALVLALVGFGVGAVQGGVLRASRWIPLLTAMVASAAGVLLFVLAGAMLGQTQLLTPGVVGLVRIAGLVAGMNAIGALPMVSVMRWAMADASVARSVALR